MTDEVETTNTEQAAPVSNGVPATTQANDDLETRVKAAEEKARREAQSAKDREIAQLHQTYQQQLSGVKGAAKRRLKTLGDQNPDDFEHEANDEAGRAEYMAWKQTQAAQQASIKQANEIASVFGLKGDDPRLLNAISWDEFREKAKRAAAEDARKEREAELQAEQEKQRKAANARVNSGELQTLQVNSAPTLGKDATTEQIIQQLETLQRNPVANLKKIKELRAKLDSL